MVLDSSVSAVGCPRIGLGLRPPIRPLREPAAALRLRAAASSSSKAPSSSSSSSSSKASSAPAPKVTIVEKTLDVLNNKTAPLVASAGLVVLLAAFASVGQRLLKLKRESATSRSGGSSLSSSFTSSFTSSSDLTSDQPLLFSELEAKMMSPLLLAAETAAEVDETSLMSLVELEDLEVTLRTLLSGMDAQLEDLRLDVIEEGVIPADVLVAMESVETVWREFELFQGYVGDQERRSFRSLLYNRSVQLKLLDQVERQIDAKRRGGAGGDSGGGEWRAPAAETATAAAKTPPSTSTQQLFYAAGATAPHANKVEKGGEDAFFVDSAAMVVGIADGVGGWERLGVDPAAYSRKLMGECEAAGAMGNASCMQILQKGFLKTDVEGSCTAIVAKYLPLERRLEVASVGDCSMRVVRHGEVVFRTDVQEHNWNQPYQLSHPPFNEADTPDDALEYWYDLVPGDVVVLGSDGLWDNLWDDELVMCISASDAMRRSYDGSVQWQQEAEELAQRLLEMAEAHSLDQTYASPFAKEREAVRRRSETFMTRLMNGMAKNTDSSRGGKGGKQDDITCVAVVIGGGEDY